MMDADLPDDEPFDSVAGQPVTYGEKRSSVLTPEGQIESIGGFARGLGARRVKAALLVGGALLLAFALLAAVS